ncbi:MAG: hypothetical protein KF749_13290 [Bacteroidetes bacterium]|nr:hypothetical protein [Bacteroidota bacterium]MCW5894332.1 hypothetical protein [Bacteroidota bacterium]
MREERISVTPSGEVQLHLPGKQYKPVRNIGWISNNEFHCERGENCIMRAFGGSIGFNYDLMKRGTFERVVVHLTYRALVTTRESVLKHGKFLHFKKNQLERQIFLPLSCFGKDLDTPPVSAPIVPIVPKPVPQLSLFAEAA